MKSGVDTIERLIEHLAKMPGLGPRSARRAVLHILRKRETYMLPLSLLLKEVAETVQACSQCGNLDVKNPCRICADPDREAHVLCVVEDVPDLWAIERTGSFKGHYHILGGVLSALNGIGPEDLNMTKLFSRVGEPTVKEMILATNATLDGQTTAHYIRERVKNLPIKVTAIAHGVPVGGELDYLDDGTLVAALRERRSF